MEIESCGVATEIIDNRNLIYYKYITFSLIKIVYFILFYYKIYI